MSDEVSMKDIPTADDMLEPYLYALKSGRAKSISTVEKEVASALGLNNAQRKYKIKGSKTTMLSNRLKSVRILLQNDGLISYSRLGKVQLTDAGKRYLEDKKEPSSNPFEQNAQEDVPQSANELVDPANNTSTQDGSHEKPRAETAKVVRKKQPDSDASHDETLQLEQDSNTSQPPTERADAIQPAAESSIFNPRNVAIAIAALIILITIICVTTCTNNSNTQTETGETPSEEAAPTEVPELSFIVEADASNSDVTVVVHVTGKTNDGKTIDEQFHEKVNTPHVLDCGAGTYQFELIETEAVDGHNAYKHDEAKVVYSGEKNVCVKLSLAADGNLSKAGDEGNRQAETGKSDSAEQQKTADTPSSNSSPTNTSSQFSPDPRVNTFVRNYNNSNPTRQLTPDDVVTVERFVYETDIDLDHMHVNISYLESTYLYVTCSSNAPYSPENKAGFLDDAKHVLQGVYNLSDAGAEAIIASLDSDEYPISNNYKSGSKYKASFRAGGDNYSNTFSFTTGDFIDGWDD